MNSYDPYGALAAQSICNQWALGNVQVSHGVDYGQDNQYTCNGPMATPQWLKDEYHLATQDAQSLYQRTRMEGSKPIVVCNGVTENCEDLDNAQRRAEELAHKHGANAYILKPVRMVAPKRDVVTTEIP